VNRTMTILSAILLIPVLVSACSAGNGGPAMATDVARFDSVTQAISPDGTLALSVGLDELGRARYRVERTHADGAIEEVIADSTLGLEVTNGEGQAISLTRDLTVLSVVEQRQSTSRFTLPTGKARSSLLTINGRRILFEGAEGERFAVDLLATDTGVAFRYALPEAFGDSDAEAPVRIEWERTSFAMDPEDLVWLQPHDGPSAYTPAYEQPRNAEANAGRPGTSAFGWTFPLLGESERSWTLITESALGPDDAGSHFAPGTVGGEFFLSFADRGEGNGFGDPRPIVTAGWASPWRIIVTSPELGDIVESDHVRHLSPPGRDRDWSWVTPGRVSWSWWSDHNSSRDADAMEPFIDLAADLGWEYSLVDANWNTFSDERLAELVDYAADRNVGLILWYNSGGPNNVVTEAPRDAMFDRETRRAEFGWLAELGVKGVKVDFFQSDKPAQIRQYREILEDAADFELMANFHGSTVPRGWSREFPNLMTMEAVRGAEIYTFFSRFAAIAPAQNTMLPFTRNVVGSMDYTPLLLGDTVRRRTTNTHELALAVLFESGLQHLADTPTAYQSQPDEIIGMLRDLPVVWDETVFLDGRPGRDVALARRHGDTWWIAAINGQDEPTNIRVDASALGIADDADVTQICDNAGFEGRPGSSATWSDPAQYEIAQIPAATISFDLVPFGGCIARTR